jgi:hypothetical protein
VHCPLPTFLEKQMLWLACAAVVLGAGFYTLTPLFKESAGNLDVDLLSETELDRLLDRKAVIDRNLQDLEFEYKMGRLSDADFNQLEAGYKNETAEVLQRLDQLDVSDKLGEAIEKDVASRKAKLYGNGSRRERSKAHCPSCGAEVIPGKKFCADCGHRL